MAVLVYTTDDGMGNYYSSYLRGKAEHIAQTFRTLAKFYLSQGYEDISFGVFERDIDEGGIIRSDRVELKIETDEHGLFDSSYTLLKFAQEGFERRDGQLVFKVDDPMKTVYS